MGKEFYESNDAFKSMFDECQTQVDIDLKAACFEGVCLDATSITQPALHCINISTYIMLESLGIKGDMFAGLSLGEYSALAAGGVLGRAVTTKIVSMRGRIMENAVPAGIASMTAVIGLDIEKIEKSIKDINDVWIANINSPAQTIIGGRLKALDIADMKIKQAGAKIVKRLNVSGPFHTPLLEKAGLKLKYELEKYDIMELTSLVYANVTGSKYHKDDDIIELLSKQVSSRVLWSDITRNVIAEADVIIECGPGNVLSKLARKQVRASQADVKVFSANSIKGVSEIKEFVIGK